MILIPENINNITQQLVESLQQLKSDLEITVNSSKITYIKRTIENPKTRKEHNFEPYNIAKYNNKFISKVIEKLEIALGNTLIMKKIEISELTPDTFSNLKTKFPINYCYYQLGKHLNIQTLYSKDSTRVFDKTTIQLLEPFIGKTNTTFHSKTVYRIFKAFENCHKLLLDPTINIITTNSIGRLTTSQFQELQQQINHTRNTSGNCKNSLREDPKQWVDFKLKNNLHRNSKKKAFSVTNQSYTYIIAYDFSLYTKIDHKIFSKAVGKRSPLNLTYYVLYNHPRAQIFMNVAKKLDETSTHFNAMQAYINVRNQGTSLSNVERCQENMTHSTSFGNNLYQQLHSKVAESENIGANHLGFMKSLFQHYSESAFNFYVNKRIAYLLKTATNTESVRETFYNKLIQNSSLPTNYNFTSIITEINKKIEHHTQQKYPITYASKDKRKLQTPAVTPKKIQPTTWKKHRIESPTNPSYYYTPKSTINITLTDIKQKKEDLLGPYNFGTASPWEVPELEGEQEEEKKESEDQEFTYQNLIPGNLEFETLNPNQNNQNPNLINQQNLPPLSQQPNLDPMAYAPIAKLDNFTSEEDNTQNTANLWYQSLINKSQDFNAFKMEFLRYFSNNNSINHLVNTFTTMKQGETEAVTTYLGHFYRNLRQIQAIDTNYFTVPQILNQFIYGLHSNIVTHARDFESAELKANHTQAVNLVMNGSSKLDSKLEKFNKTINQKIEEYLANNNQTIYQPPQRHHNQENSNHPQNQPHPSLLTNQQWQQEMHICHYCGKQKHIQINCCHTISNHLSANNTATNLSTISISNPNLSTADNLPATATSNISTTVTSNLSALTINPNTTPKPSSNDIRRSQTQNHPKLKIGDGHSPTNHQPLLPTHWIMLSEFGYWFQPKPEFPTLFKSFATITNDKSLATIFPFELEETTIVLLFSRAVLEEKPITAMYTNMKVDGHFIKLILDSRSAGSIITRQLMDQLSCQVDHTASARIITADGATKTPIGEIDNLFIEVNDIIIPIKVLVIEATQYQALIGNDWLFKASTIMNWNIQEVQLSQHNQHTRVPAICGHFKSNHLSTPLIELKEEKLKPTWEAYQVSWADNNHNKLLLILLQEKWDNESCLACGETLLDERMWNNIPGQGGICDTLCHCPHDNDEIWKMVMAKIEGASFEEIREIKNNPPELIELNWDPEPVINLLDPKQFHEHYQELTSTKEEQKQHLE
ncbi:hypothetical protein G9A89_016315 [Geosiphon pyriformis]|nr:hypothetical protein G9A89_016315 [Geosiphon pyriformis]